MKKSRYIPLMAMILAIFIFGVCGQSVAAEKAAPDKIRLGVCTGLTGAFAGFGVGGAYGIKAAVADINKEGGVFVKEYGKKIPLEVVVVDNESDESKAATLAQELILRDKVHIIVNGMDPPHMRAPIATVCDRYKTPMVTGVGPYEAWMGMRNSMEKPWQYTWASSFAIGTPAQKGDFREGKLGYCMMDSYLAMMDKLEALTNKRVAAFASDEPDGRGWYLAFAPLMKEKGFDIYRVEEEFGLVPMETTDFSSLIRGWKKNKCEILWANSPAPFFGAMWRQARRMGFKPKQVYATRAGLFYLDIKAWGPGMAHGVCNEMFWNPAIKDSPGIGKTTPQSLNERWMKDSGEPMHQNVGMGYAHTQVVIDAIQRAGSLDADKLQKALKKTDLMTIYHRIKFDDEQFSRMPVGFGQWIKTNKPYVWENPIVISFHDFLPAESEMLFPIPYD
jgi:branched-chain amino acid transport system substrate-binding protein